MDARPQSPPKSETIELSGTDRPSGGRVNMGVDDGLLDDDVGSGDKPTRQPTDPGEREPGEEEETPREGGRDGPGGSGGEQPGGRRRPKPRPPKPVISCR